MSRLLLFTDGLLLLMVIGLAMFILKERWPWASRVGGGALAAAALLGLGAPLVYEFPLNDTVVVRKDGSGTMEICPEGTWEWGYETFRVPTHVTASSRASIVTENPKVHDFRYTLVLRCADPVLFLKGSSKRKSQQSLPFVHWDAECQYRRELMTRIIDFHCYEFNNAHSRVLAELYNPLDPEQQKRFLEFVRDHLNEPLRADGLEVEGAAFSLK